ncbi:hypothetical protein AMTR_s00027p00041360 [Amborella trichopoda]|uniref:Disease resistance N-terminal domain-containing protein n=1 Tax=Amborella trichopoda TaxID=13333 RepID=W1PRP5_AMBTC|nr:hypothetical protein AMTR_s00027p00041360 [Amborella trichopoda]
MAETATIYLLKKIGGLLSGELKLFSGVEDQVGWIEDEIEGTRVFLKRADKEKERKEGVDVWVRQQPMRCMECLVTLLQFIEEIKINHQFGSTIRSVEARVNAMDMRKNRLDLQREDGEASSLNAMT